MRKMLRRLRGKCGESLVESMCAILIFTLSSIALLSMIAAASSINRTVEATDNATKEQMAIAEQQSTEKITGKKVVLKLDDGAEIASVDVDLYRSGDDENSLYSYAKAHGEGES